MGQEEMFSVEVGGDRPRALVIGAGFGGIAAALRRPQAAIPHAGARARGGYCARDRGGGSGQAKARERA